jgi:peptidoglycan/LPS O-acetylase OafA/YrhL
MAAGEQAASQAAIGAALNWRDWPLVRAAAAVAVLALLLTVFPTSGADGVSPASWQVDAVYWALLGATALMVGGFATVLGALYATIREIFETLPCQWVDEILAEEAADERP